MKKIILLSLFLATLFFRVQAQSSVINGLIKIDSLSSASITGQIATAKAQAIAQALAAIPPVSGGSINVAQILQKADSAATAKDAALFDNVMSHVFLHLANYFTPPTGMDSVAFLLTRYHGVQYAKYTEYSVQAELKPVVRTGSILSSLTTHNAAAIPFYVLGAGGSPVTAAGITYGTAINPTVLKTSPVFTGVGTSTGFMTGLLPSTTYYARTYATNLAGTSYGDNVTFTTSSAPVTSCYTVDLSTNPANLSNHGGCYTVIDGTGNYGATDYVDIEISDGSVNGYTIHFNSLDLKSGDFVKFYTWADLGTGIPSKSVTGTSQADFTFEKFMRVIFSTNGDSNVGAGFSFTITPN